MTVLLVTSLDSDSDQGSLDSGNQNKETATTAKDRSGASKRSGSMQRGDTVLEDEWPSWGAGESRRKVGSAQMEPEKTPTIRESGASSAVDTFSTVTFIASGENLDEVSSGTGYGVAMRLLGDDTSEVRRERFPGSAKSVAVELSPGAYIACLVDADGMLGPCLDFEVDDGDCEVKLSTVTRFTFRMRYLEQVSLTPLHGVVVEAKFADHPFDESARDLTVSGMSDAGGHVSISDLIPGSYEFCASKDGYQSVEYLLNLPGDWKISNGSIDAGDAALDRLRTVGFQLIGDDEIGDWSGYQIAHTHAGTRVDFDANGQAELSVAHSFGSLYIKLWGPDDWGEVRFLDGGLPEEGEHRELYVGAGRSLDVDLRIAPSRRAAIEGKKFNIAAYFVSESMDGVASSRDVDGEGIYSLRGIDGSSVMLAVQEHREDGPLPWVTKKVVMDAHGRTTCIVNLDRRPTRLRVVDHTGASLDGVNVLVRENPDATRWLTGGTTGADGEIELPLTEASCIGRFDWTTKAGTFAMAIGIPLELDSPEPRDIEIGSLRQFSVRLTVGEQARAGAHFAVRGHASSETVSYLTTNENGIAGPILLADGSSGFVLLENDTLWTDEPRFPLASGEIHVLGYDYGRMEASSKVDWSLVSSQRLGVSIADWLDSGRVTLAETTRGKWIVRVPVGRYAITPAPGVDAREIVVTTGEVVDTGL